MSKLPPGPGPLSFMSSFASFRKDPVQFSDHLFKKYGDTLSSSFGPIRFIMTKSPELIAHVLKKNPENYKKSFAYDLMKPIFGDGLLVAHGNHWKENRARMQSAFGPEQLKIYEPQIEKLTEQMLEEWYSGELRDAQEDIVKLTLGIIGKCLFGEDIRSFGSNVSQAMITIMEHVDYQILHPVHLPSWVPSARNRKYHRAIQVIEEIAQNLIEVILKQDPPAENSKTLLARLLPKEQMTPEIRKNLRDQIMTLLITGHDTSANILTFSLQVLKQRQDVYDRLKLSLKSHPGLDNPDLHAFINEMMRLYPPVWMASRTTLEDDTYLGYDIPKNTLLIFSTFHLHRDPTHWHNPEVFDLDRFKHPPKPDTFIPFGAGPRACVAMALGMMEMKIVLRRIITELEYDILEGKEVQVLPTLTLKPKNRVMAKFKKKVDL